MYKRQFTSWSTTRTVSPVTPCSASASSTAPSSSEKLAGAVLDALAEHGVTGETLRVVDHDVKPGALNDVGFTIAAQGATYWNGEAMHGEDYNDLDETPEAVATTTKTLAANTAHLARLLKGTPYSKAD